MKTKLKILHLEDLPADAELVERTLSKGHILFEKLVVDTEKEFIKSIKEFKPDIILSDHSLPSFNSVEALKIVKASGLNIPFILITATVSEDFAVSVLKQGADDYILKDNLSRLPSAIAATLKQKRSEKAIQETVEQLKENEERYRTLVERVSDGFMALDLNWCFTYINKKAEQLFNKGYNFLIGKNIWEEFPEAFDKSFHKAYQTAMDTQENIQLKEYSIEIGKWVDANIYPSATGISVYFRDVTDQKKTEKSLKESEKKYRSIFYKSPLPKWIFDCETLRFLEVNDMAVQHYGYTQEEFLNMTIRDIRPKEDVQLLLDDLKINSDQNIMRSTWRHLKKNGEFIIVETTAHDIDYNNRKARMVVVNDITESKKAEEALREGEARYRNVVENIHEALIIEDRDGNLVYANTEFYRMFGYSPETDQGLSLTNYTAASSYDEVLKRHNNRLEGMNVAEEFEYKGVRKDGTEIWIEARVSTILENNKIVGTQSLERDITERKKAEEELSRNELRFRTLTGNAPVGIFQTDAVGKTIYINETWMEYTGLTFKEAVGDGWIVALHPDDKKLQLSQWIDKSKKGVESSSEFRLIDKKGNTRWVIGKATPLFDKNSNVSGYIGTLSDITEIKKAEEKFREFFETAPEAVLVLDPDTRGFIDYNENALKLLGYTKQEIIGKSPLDFSPEYQADGQRSLEKIIEMARVALAGGFPIFDFILVNKKGEEIYCEIRLTLLTKTEQPLIRASILDIGERVRLEKKVIQGEINKQVEITDAVINAQEQERAFLGEEMHDNINQLLATSKLYLDFSMSTDVIRKDMIITGRNFVMDAMEEIRKLSKSLIAPSLGEMTLEEAIADMITSIQLVHKIHFEKEWEIADEKKMTEKFKLAIFRIIQEQLNNIIKHSQAINVWIKLIQENDKLQLIVKDDGVGFDTTSKKQGVGLKNIGSRSSLFHGAVDIISAPGQGCEIQVMFDLKFAEKGGSEL